MLWVIILFLFSLFWEKWKKLYFNTKKTYKITNTLQKRVEKLSWVHLLEQHNPNEGEHPKYDQIRHH